MSFVRWTNLVCAALLFGSAVILALFVAGVLGPDGPEASPVWLGVVWAVILAALAILCLVNAQRRPRRTRADGLAVSNAAVAIALILLFWLVNDDPITATIVAICALGPAVALGGIVFGPRAKRG